MAISKKNGFLVPLAKEEDFDENFDKAEKAHPLIWLLRLTGLYFGELKNGAFWYFIGMFRALLLCSLSIYQTGFMTYLLVTRKFDQKTPIYIFLLSWNIQATLSIIFVIYWQLKGHLSTLLSMVKWPPKNSKYKETRKSIRSVLIIFAVVLTFILINFYFVYYHLFTKNQKWLLLDLEFFDIYSSNYLKCLGAFVGIINANTSLVVLTFYIIVCHILNGEFMVFNKELMKVGSKGHQETVGDQLLHEYTTHIKMAKMVRLVDSTFEVYTFAMIGMNIPTTIFSLISCFTAVSTEHLVLIVPAPLFCILQLFGLTSIPARVHTAIQQVRNILFSNMKIWKPFNEKTYQIASIFVSHVDQANLGISVWGFAVVTKPLILTTISLTITYLTLLLQLKINKKGDLQAITSQNMTEVKF